MSSSPTGRPHESTSLPRRRRVLNGLRSAAAVALMVCVAAWLVGRVATDRFLWSQFLFWIPTVAALIASLIASLLMLPAPPSRRWRRIARGSALITVAIALYWSLLDHRLLRLPVAGAFGEPTIAILHCNLHWPGKRAAPEVIEFLRDRSEDLVLFSEPGWLLLQNRGAALEAAGWQVVRVPHFAVLSRLPIVEWRPLVAAEGMAFTLLRIDGSTIGRPTLSICLVDLPSEPRTPRMALARTARALLDEVGAPEFDLVAGDFNMTRDGAAIATLFPNFSHAFHQAGRGFGATYPATRPLWHIDHILIGPSLRAVDYRLIRLPVSLHLGQEVRIIKASSAAQPAILIPHP